MDIRLLFFVLVSVVTARNTEHELGEQMLHLLRSDDVDGSSLATLHALDTATGQFTGQSKSDIEEFASNSSSDKTDFSLHLTSGEHLRMTLKRHSIDTSGATVTEVKEDGTRETTQLQTRDCYFSGPLEGGQGFVSLSMCGGRLMGSITTPKRAYELHALPDKGSSDDVMHVMVTWKNTEHAQEHQTEDEDEHDELEIPEEEDDDETAEHDEEVGDRTRRSVEDRTATVEIAIIMDEFYINALKAKNITTTEDITNFAFNKWNKVAYVVSDEKWVTWNLTLKLVTLEIWRTNPKWYRASKSQTLMERMQSLCWSNNTFGYTYDQITLHTGPPMKADPKIPGVVGLAWVGGVCKKKFRCSAVTGTHNGLDVELHELGHSLGLRHDNNIKFCKKSKEDTWRGFMGGNKTHFKRCYRHVFDLRFKKKALACLFEEKSIDKLNWNFDWDRK